MASNKDDASRTSAPTALSWALILGLTILALLVTYSSSYFPPDPTTVMGRHDQWAYFGPMAFYMDTVLRQGELPLWNPLTFCGTPFAANPQAAVFYPPHFLRGVLNFSLTPFSTHLSLAAMVMGHFILLSAGLFFLCRDHRLSRAASTTAAFAFVFSANLVMRVPQHWHFIAIIAWAPFLLLLFRRTLAAQGRVRFIQFTVGTGVVFGVTILVGFPQQSIYTFLLLAGYGIVHALLYPRKRSLPRAVARSLLAIMLAGLVALVVAAPILVPAYEFAQHTARTKIIGEPYLPGEVQVSPLYFLRGLIEYSGVTWPGSTGIRMMGAGALLLAAASLFHRRWKDILLYGGLFLIFIDCALGPPFPFGSLIDRVAPFRVDNPARATTYACFILAILTAFGVDALTGHGRFRTRRNVTAYVVGVGLPVVFLLYGWMHPRPYLPVSIMGWILPAITLMAMVASIHWHKRALLAPAFVALIFFETLVWSPELIQYIVKTEPYIGDYETLDQTAQFSLENKRVISPYLRENEALFRLEPAMTGYDPLYIEASRHVLAAPSQQDIYYRRLRHWEMTRDSNRGYQLFKRRFWLSRQYVTGPLPPKDSLFPVATTAFIEGAAPEGIPKVDMKDLSADGMSDTATMRRVLPLNEVRLVRMAPVDAKDDKAQVETVFLIEREDLRHAVLRLNYASNSSWHVGMEFVNVATGERQYGKDQPIDDGPSPRSLIYPLPDVARLECVLTFTSSGGDRGLTILSASLLTDEADEDDRIEIISASANEIHLRVHDSPGPRILTYLDSAYPGWKAFVDGKPAELYRAAEAFKAVVVPAGAHEIRFIFKSKTVATGLMVANLFLAVSLVAAIGLLRKTFAKRKGCSH